MRVRALSNLRSRAEHVLQRHITRRPWSPVNCEMSLVKTDLENCQRAPTLENRQRLQESVEALEARR